MGKRLIPQRRGSGRPRYKVPSHRYKSKPSYPEKLGSNDVVGGQVTGFIKDISKTAPIAEILLENQQSITLIAPEGMRIGDWINFGDKEKPQPGNILALENINEGTPVFNIELNLGDGGKLVRAGGSSAQVVSHERKKGLTYVKLPSKKIVPIKNKCRATIGQIAAAGRKEKPMVHAGQMYHKQKRKGKLYPRVSGVAMNAVDHPHGGGRHPHVGKPSTISRNTPAGRKAGHISAKRTGKRKR